MPTLSPSSTNPYTSVEHEVYLTLQVLATRLRDDTEHLLKPSGLIQHPPDPQGCGI